jgi:hypothetical protein
MVGGMEYQGIPGVYSDTLRAGIHFQRVEQRIRRIEVVELENNIDN